MWASVDKSAIKAVRLKIKRLNSLHGADDKLANSMAEEARRIAESNYREASFNASIIVTQAENGTAYISAIGDGIAYEEFGTGLAGKGTYRGKLPTMKLTFKAPGDKHWNMKEHSTSGWVHYYDNKFTKVDGGWFFKNDAGNLEFTTGQKAGAEMYNTANELGAKLSKVVSKRFRKRKKK